MIKLSRVLQIIARPYGISVERERDMLVSVANRIEEEMYAAYENDPFFTDVESCLPVRRFCEDCHNCVSQFHGITLPRDMESEQAIWVNSQKIRVFTEWKEAEIKTGRRFGNNCGPPVGYILPERAPTLIEPQNKDGFIKIGIVARESNDEGKIVTLEGHRGNDHNHEVSFKSSTQPVIPDRELTSLKRVILPDERCGMFDVIDYNRKDNPIISSYHPSEECVPDYERIKLTNVGCSCVVKVKANRRRLDLSMDNDIVRVAGQQIWTIGAKMVKLIDQGESEADLRKSAALQGKFQTLLKAAINRKRGAPKDDQVGVHQTNYSCNGNRLCLFQ